jgi:hypothetical protein
MARSRSPLHIWIRKTVQKPIELPTRLYVFLPEAAGPPLASGQIAIADLRNHPKVLIAHSAKCPPRIVAYFVQLSLQNVEFFEGWLDADEWRPELSGLYLRKAALKLPLELLKRFTEEEKQQLTGQIPKLARVGWRFVDGWTDSWVGITTLLK